MKKFIDKWAKARVEKIAKQEAHKKEADEQNKARKRNSENIIRKYITSFLDDHANSMSHMTMHKCHLSPGDRAVVNVYGLGRNGYNQWDTGPSQVLQGLGDIEEPVIVDIVTVAVSKSYAMEQLDLYIASLEPSQLEYLAGSENTACILYRKYLKDKGRNWIRNHGLFWFVTYDTGKGQKTAAVNADSFLKMWTPEAADTIAAWDMHIKSRRAMAESTAYAERSKMFLLEVRKKYETEPKREEQ